MLGVGGLCFLLLVGTCHGYFVFFDNKKGLEKLREERVLSNYPSITSSS